MSNSPVGVWPIGYDPLDGDVYGLNVAGLAVVDGASGKTVATISNVYDPEGYLFDPANGDMYISNNAGYGELVVVNGTTNQEVARIELYTGPGAMAYNPVNRAVYVACTYPYVNMTGVILVVPSEVYPLPVSGSTSPFEIFGVLAILVVTVVAMVVLLVRRRAPPSRPRRELAKPPTEPKRP